MDDDERRNETAEAADDREEDVVKDTDADTRDVEDEVEETRADYNENFEALSAKLDNVLAELASLREAQGIMVENGMTVSEAGEVFDDADDDGINDADELDLTL